MTELRVVEGDITTMTVDAIVNAANAGLRGGGGVDGAIHAAGGPAILEECRRLISARGPLHPGEAVLTGAGALTAQAVIHTVGPIWGDAPPDEQDGQLAACYESALLLCDFASETVLHFGTDEQKERYLPPIAEGTEFFGGAITKKIGDGSGVAPALG